jgi:hypothetical protein
VGAVACDDCGVAKPSTSTDSAPSASASAAVDAAAARVFPDAGELQLDPLCAALLGEEHLEKDALHPEDLPSYAGPRMHCVAGLGAAWAVRIDPPDGKRSVRQTLLFAAANNVRAREVSTLENVEWPPVLGRHSALFDLDGDGTPEFFTALTDVKTFTPVARNLVSYKNGKIAPYPTGGLGFVVDGMSDIDKDGHADLRVSFELGKRTVCAPGDEGQVKVELVAHGLAGGKFSLDDDMATGAASTKCPSMPAADAMFLPSIDPKDPEARDLSLPWVSCSRMRGKSTDAVTAELQAACAKHAEATKKCAGPCRHLPDALAVAKFVPPLRL